MVRVWEWVLKVQSMTPRSFIFLFKLKQRLFVTGLFKEGMLIKLTKTLTQKESCLVWDFQTRNDLENHKYAGISLTQFYSVDFSQSRIGVKKCVFNKRTVKVCLSCCWRCPGTSPLARNNWRCPCISVVPEATHEASQGPLKGAVVRDGDEGVARRNEREKCFPDEGSLICPRDFSQKRNKKIELVTRPCVRFLRPEKILRIISTVFKKCF